MQPITACRACSSLDLREVLDLGEVHINAFPAPDEPNTPKSPLELVLCGECHFLQLRHSVEPDRLYRHFWYRSGITGTMRLALEDVVSAIRERIQVGRGDTVVDIGSNDSTLLRCWNGDVERIGFEPAKNLIEEAVLGGNIVVNDYFSAAGFREVTGKKAKVVTAIAMFYDLEDPRHFCREVMEILAKDGLFVVQMAYLPAMLVANDVGNVCHEHLGYYSLTSLEPVFEGAGLHIFDVEENDVNGGSFRVYAAKDVRHPTTRLINLRIQEQTLGLNSDVPYVQFGERALALKARVKMEVESAPQPVYVYGASTKGNTMLQWWEFGRAILPGAAERDTRKFGLETVGTRIPIVSEEKARAKAKTFLVLPYHFKDEILKREADWIINGGTMIFPLPRVKVVNRFNLWRDRCAIDLF